MMSRPRATSSSSAVGCQKILQQDLRRRMPRSRERINEEHALPLPAAGACAVDIMLGAHRYKGENATELLGAKKDSLFVKQAEVKGMKGYPIYPRRHP